MEKLNIAEILRSCPKGMELDCTICNGVKFIELSSNHDFAIVVRANNGYEFSLTKYGQVHNIDDAKCVIFPKGKNTWEGFQRPFKDGDVVVDTLGGIHIMRNASTSYCYFDRLGILDKTETSCVRVDRLATEEEKKKLFDAIKAKGYKWNPKTKTLEKLIEPKFKVGDEVRYKGESTVITITDVKDNYYFIKFYNPRKSDYQAERISFKDQDYWELVPNKFDITTLKPFESRVLVRSSMDGLWKPAVFGFRNGYNDNAFYIVGGSCWKQCIPYLNNEHLCGTTNDCDEYYKTW